VLTGRVAQPAAAPPQLARSAASPRLRDGSTWRHWWRPRAARTAPDIASADGEGVRSGGGLAPSRIFTSSRPKLPRARMMMTIVSCSLVVTGPADTSRGANRMALYAAIHDHGRQRCQRCRDHGHPLREQLRRQVT
jgi:hypothetical protein